MYYAPNSRTGRGRSISPLRAADRGREALPGVPRWDDGRRQGQHVRGPGRRKRSRTAMNDLPDSAFSGSPSYDVVDTEASGAAAEHVDTHFSIVDLYRQLESDPSLQKDWEVNQPRWDRCIEAPLIVRTTRECATAALVWLKLQFWRECRVHMPSYLPVDPELRGWVAKSSKDLCMGGPLLFSKIIDAPGSSEDEIVAAVASLKFYRERASPNPLVKNEWPLDALRNLAVTSGGGVFSATRLPLANGKLKGEGVVGVLQLLVCPPDPLRPPLPMPLTSGISARRTEPPLDHRWRGFRPGARDRATLRPGRTGALFSKSSGGRPNPPATCWLARCTGGEVSGGGSSSPLPKEKEAQMRLRRAGAAPGDKILPSGRSSSSSRRSLTCLAAPCPPARSPRMDRSRRA
jgi:hypothetical protein